jgi:hypothetical protein
LGGDELIRLFFIILLAFPLIITGCIPANTFGEKEKKIENEKNSILIVENRSATKLIDSNNEFTYLEDLTMDKLDKFNLFLEDGNINHLTDFTPEQTVLIFMNLILNNKEDRIYSLTYDNNHLPSRDTFTNEYREYLSHKLDEDYLKYRFYDSIEVNEETRKKEELVVQITIIFGTKTHIVAYGLKREENVWKIDLYHSIEELKKG